MVTSEIISKRKFFLKDNLDFSIFCGDINPIHVDRIAARRTLYGQCIVHGIHALLWALDCLVEAKGITVTKLKTKFIRPIFLDEVIDLFWDPKKNQLTLQTDGVLLASISVTTGIIRLNAGSTIEAHPVRNNPADLTLSECIKLLDQPFKVFGDIALAKKLFPNFLSAYGELIVSEVGGSSQLVGMECPGLHSLFASLKLNLNEKSKSSFQCSYEVRGDERFNLLNITIEGSAITAEVEAFYRPAPSLGQPISEIASSVRKGEFTGIRALVIGGSRGLGALVSKIISAGGGAPIITYNTGKIEAVKLAEEIIQFGQKCEIMQLTVARDMDPSFNFDFNQLYYFATPKILGKRSKNFDIITLNQYQEIYVDAFKLICQKLLDRNHHCSIFYPSTIFADDLTTEFENYGKAKIQGEVFCKTLNESEILRVISIRLPRLATDQNQSMIEIKYDNATDILIDLIRKM